MRVPSKGDWADYLNPKCYILNFAFGLLLNT